MRLGFPKYTIFSFIIFTFAMCTVSGTDEKNRVHVLPFSQTLTIMQSRARATLRERRAREPVTSSVPVESKFRREAREAWYSQSYSMRNLLAKNYNDYLAEDKKNNNKFIRLQL